MDGDYQSASINDIMTAAEAEIDAKRHLLAELHNERNKVEEWRLRYERVKTERDALLAACQRIADDERGHGEPGEQNQRRAAWEFSQWAATALDRVQP